MFGAGAPITIGYSVRRVALLASAAACVATAAFADPTDAPPAGGVPQNPAPGGEAGITNGGTTAPPASSPYGLPPAPTAPQPGMGPPIFFSPLLGLQEDWTDNARLTGNNQQSDFITRVLAGVDASVNLGRLEGALKGLYSYDWYSQDSSQNGKSVSGTAAGTYTILRDRLWIEADGTVTTGYTTTFGQSGVNRSGLEGRAQVGIYRIGPQFETELGGIGDFGGAANFGQVFYSHADSTATQPLPDNDNIYNAALRFDTADRLGRLELLTTGQLEQDNHGFHTYNGVESVYFGLTPRVRLIARAGYERVYQTDVADINSPLLSAGVEFRLNEESILTLEGGQRYKRPAWAADALFRVSRLLTISGYYRESFAPDQLYVAGSFAEFVAGTASLPAPVVPTTLTPQENVYNEASFNKTGVLRLNLDDRINQLTLEANWTQRRFTTTDIPDKTLTGYFTYARALRPDLSLVFAANYGKTFSSPIYGPSENYSGSAALLYLVNTTTNLRGSYVHTEGRQLAGARATYGENAIVIAVEKRF